VDLPRVAGLGRGTRQRAAAGQRIDQARLADIGAAGESDFRKRDRRQRLERGGAGDKHARPAEQLARRPDLVRRPPAHQPFLACLWPFLPPPPPPPSAGAGRAVATAGLALPPIGAPWRRMMVYCWAIDRVLLHAQ